MSFPHVVTGDKVQFSAGFINRIADLANESSVVPSGTISSNTQAEIITIKNNTSSFVEANGILGLGDYLSESSGSIPTELLMMFRSQSFAILGEEPDEDLHTGKFCILSQGLAAGEIGKAWVGGTVPVLVNVTDADHNYAELKDADSTQLKSGSAGSAQIIWKESGTGSKWAAVRLISGGSGSGTIINPYVISPGSGSTASTDTWDVTAQPTGYDGVEITAITRTYSDSSANKIYNFVRPMKYNSAGALVYVGAESKTEDTAGESLFDDMFAGLGTWVSNVDWTSPNFNQTLTHWDDGIVSETGLITGTTECP